MVFITENGMMHTVPANKIPFGKFRDKSIPVDNVSTLDTTTDLILYAEAMKLWHAKRLSIIILW